jgi:hypothetical protein
VDQDGDGGLLFAENCCPAARFPPIGSEPIILLVPAVGVE